jgi:hypothetical protein
MWSLGFSLGLSGDSQYFSKAIVPKQVVNGFTFYHLVIAENQQIIAYRHQKEEWFKRTTKEKLFKHFYGLFVQQNW